MARVGVILATTLVAACDPESSAVDAAQDALWLSPEPTLPVVDAAPWPDAPLPLTQSPWAVTDLAVDEDAIYWTTSVACADGGCQETIPLVFKAPKTGGAATRLAMGVEATGSVAVEGGDVYYANWDGTVALPVLERVTDTGG